jgi:penicillin-binding protein 2
MRLKPSEQVDAHFDRRLNSIAWAILIALIVLVLRLWQLQVIHWAEYNSKSNNNRLRTQRLDAPRGVIYGRLGLNQEVVLVDDGASNDLLFVLADCDEDIELVCTRLESLIVMDGQRLREELASVRKANRPYEGLLVKRNIQPAVLGRVQEYSYALPGVFSVIRHQRRYHYGRVAGHVLGYINEIGPEELKRRDTRYRTGDLIGRAGIEWMYEDRLHGKEGLMLVTQYAAGDPQLRTDPYGKTYVEVDDYGHQLVEERVQNPIPGEPVYLSLDIALQEKAEQLLGDEVGAIVVLNAQTGAILALASSPGYDPNAFVTAGMNETRRRVLHSEPNRLLNRSYQGEYAPGSVFKILMAIAALEEGVIDRNTTYTCTGRFMLQEGAVWHCWRRNGHGKVNLVDALAFSCDVFFYNVGIQLGVDKIYEWSSKAGFGNATGIDLPGESQGLAPYRFWREEKLRTQFPKEPWNQRWFLGDTVNLSIGQGFFLATPLQNATLMAAVINGGRRVRPYLNSRLSPVLSEPFASEATLALVTEGLTKCIEKGPPAPTGTGHGAAVKGMVVIGKTGTAQVASLAHRKSMAKTEIPRGLRHHALFVAGTPTMNPPLAISIIIEHGESGSEAAAPLAHELITYFYSELRPPEFDLAARGKSPVLGKDTP